MLGTFLRRLRRDQDALTACGHHFLVPSVAEDGGPLTPQKIANRGLNPKPPDPKRRTSQLLKPKP